MIRVKDFWVEPSVRSSLEEAGLTEPEALMKRDFDWFEAPNKRRGGWSGVTRLELPPTDEQKSPLTIFFKIQQNHFYVSWRNAFSKRLSYQREFHAEQFLRQHFSFVPKPLLYIEWRTNGNQLSVIATEALEGWTCFHDWMATEPNREQIESILIELASALRAMHQKRWAHFGLFQKHIFFRFSETGPEIKLIDFEKARKCPTRRQCILEDVSRFLRHSKNLNEELQTVFLQSYFETDSLKTEHRDLIQRMRGVHVLKGE